MAANSSHYPIAWSRNPELGPKALSVLLDLTTTTPISVDLLPELQQRWIDVIKAVFVDNFTNAQALTLTFNTGMKIIVPAARQGIFPVIMGMGDFKFTAASTGAVKVPVIFLNIDMPFGYWGN